MKTLNPLRYPGGKTVIKNIFTQLIANDESIELFIEPYAGGAGLGLWLLENGYIHKFHLNDADEFIYKFWYSVLFLTDELINKIYDTKISMEEWNKQRAIIQYQTIREGSSVLDIGFAALFLNRCNRSGIIRADVGPIGGKEQVGNWKIDARFNKGQIISKITSIAKISKQIMLTNFDAIYLIDNYSNNSQDMAGCLFYLDPPYYKNGEDLYRSYYNKADHELLNKFLKDKNSIKWILSYDNAEFIKALYKDYEIQIIHINHHANKQKNGSELLIFSPLIG